MNEDTQAASSGQEKLIRAISNNMALFTSAVMAEQPEDRKAEINEAVRLGAALEMAFSTSVGKPYEIELRLVDDGDVETLMRCTLDAEPVSEH